MPTGLEAAVVKIDVVLLWAVIAALLCGVGALAARTSGVAVSRWRFAHFWIGLATVVAAMQLLHLVSPIDAGAQVLVAGAGIVGLLIGPWHRPAAPRSWQAAAAVVATAVLTAYVARHALVLPRAYDTGTYHLPLVGWFNAFPVVPGLANLHVRFGFNTSILLYDALLNAGPLHGMAVHLGLGLLAIALGAELIAAVAGFASEPTAIRLAAAVALPCFLAITFSTAFEGLSPDIVLYCWELQIGLLMLRLMVGRRDTADDAFVRAAIIWLAVIGVTIKLSFLPFGVLACAWTFIAGPSLVSPRTRIVLTGGVVVTAAAWVARGIVLSGYVLFPSPALAMPVAWRVPRGTVVQLDGWVRAWARVIDDRSMTVPYEQLLSGWGWVRPWAAHAVADVWTVSFPLGAFIVTVGAIVLTTSGRRLVTRQQVTAIAVVLLALVAWFVTAPDIRFAGSLFVVAAMFAIATLVTALRTSPLMSSRLVTAVSVVAALALARQAVTMGTWWRTWPPAVSIRAEPAQAVVRFVTANGLTVQVPAGTETCWSAALPCTPYPSAALAMRNPADLADGFTVKPFAEDALAGWWSGAHPWVSMHPRTTSTP